MTLLRIPFLGIAERRKRRQRDMRETAMLRWKNHGLRHAFDALKGYKLQGGRAEQSRGTDSVQRGADFDLDTPDDRLDLLGGRVGFRYVLLVLGDALQHSRLDCA